MIIKCPFCGCRLENEGDGYFSCPECCEMFCIGDWE